MLHLHKRLIAFILASLLFIPPAFSSTELKDEGTSQGYINIIDCVGAGISCSKSNITGSFTVGSSGAPTDATYVTQSANGSLSAEFSLGSLTTGLLLNTVTAGTGTPSAYGGTSCTNQFPISLNASGSATCNSVDTAYITNAAVSYSKIQNVSTTDKILGRSSAGAGSIEEITFNDAAQDLAQETVADDQVEVYDSATAGTPRTLPNCTDSGGNHLNYTQATNSFSCGTTSGGASAPLTLTGSSDTTQLIVIGNATQTSALASYRDSDGSPYFTIPGLSSTYAGSENLYAGLTAGDSTTSGSYNVYLGSAAGTADTTGLLNVYIGRFAGQQISGQNNNIIIGGNTAYNSSSIGGSNTIIGAGAANSASAAFSNNVVIGAAIAGALTTASNIVMIGNSVAGSLSSATDVVALGYQAGNGLTTTGFSVFLGTQAGFAQTAGNTTGIGYRACFTPTTGASNTCIGQNADTSTTSVDSSIAIGRGAIVTANNQLAIGGSGYSITDGYIGNGVTNAAPANFTLNGTGGSGTDINGADLILAAGKSTGNATGGDLIFQTATPGSTGTTLQTLATRGSFKQSGVFNLVPQASPPASPVSGDMYVDSTPAPDALCFYNGTDWDDISTAATDANCA